MCEHARVVRAPTLAFFAAVALAACTVDTNPSGLQATPPGSGPVIVFDVLHRPLPDIPLVPTGGVGIEQVIAVVRPANTRAIAMVRRLGMEWVGETDKYHSLRLQVYRLRPADLAPPAYPLQ